MNDGARLPYENNQGEEYGPMMLQPVRSQVPDLRSQVPDLRYPEVEIPRQSNADSDDFQALWQLLQTLWRRKWTLAVCLALGAFIALASSLYMDPLYRAQAS